MEARMKNPAALLPGAWQAVQAISEAAQKGGVPPATMGLVHLRVSQINGCSSCVHSGSVSAKKAGDSDERIAGVAAWRDTPFYSEAERAALSLAESETRLADRPEPVPDEIWDEAARHYDEKQLAALVLWIATTNIFNRLNVTTRQVAGGTWG